MFNARKLLASFRYGLPTSRTFLASPSNKLITCKHLGNQHGLSPSNCVRNLSLTSLKSATLSSSSNSLSNARDKSFQTLEASIITDRKVSLKKLLKFIDELKVAKSITSSESLLAIRCCGAYLLECTIENRNRLTDEIWNLLESKSAPLDISHYNALLNVYIDNEYPVNPAKFLDLLSQRKIKPNRVTYHRLLHLYCQRGDLEGAQKILLEMKAANMPVHEGVFNSLIYGNMKSGDIKAGESVLDLMKDNKIEPSSETFVILMKSYALHMNQPEVVEKMRNLIKSLNRQEYNFTFDQYVAVIDSIADHDDKSPLIDEILAAMPKQSGFNTALSKLIIKSAYKQKIEFGLKLVSKMLRNSTNDNYNSVGGFYIYHLVKSGTAYDEVMKVCNLLESTGTNEWTLWKATEAALHNLQDKDEILKYLKSFQAKTGLYRPHFIWPLICRMKNNEEMLNLLKEEVVPYAGTFGIQSMSETFRFYVWPRIKNNQNEFMSKCIEMGLDSKLLLCTLADSAQIEGLGITFTDVLNKKPLPRNISDIDVSRVLSNLVNNVNNGLLAKEMLKFIIDETRLPVTNRMLLPVYTQIIKSCDKDTALKEWLDCVKQYNQVPCKAIMFQKLIEAEDTENLQKVTDICISRIGERETLINLTLAFLRSKKDKQAMKILSKPILQRYEIGLQRIVGILSKQNETESLERFILLTKDLDGIDREKLYYTLLDSFIQNDKPQKALELWTTMQDENLIPSPRIISRLSRFLKEKGVEVPFKYQDEIKEGEEIIATEDAKFVRDQFHTFIRNGNLDKALAIKNRYNAPNSPLTLGDECTLIDRLIRSNRTDKALQLTKSVMAGGRFPAPRIYKALLEKMAQEGLFREIGEMIESLPAPLKETSWFSDTVIFAYTHSKNPDIDSLLRILPSLKPLPFASILELLNAFPKFEKPIFNALEELSVSRGTNTPKNIIWLQLMKMSRFEEAKQLFNSIPDFKETVVFKTLLFDIKRNKNLMLGYNLIDQLNKTDLNAKAKGAVYDAMIYALLEKNMVKEAHDLLLEGLEINKDKENQLTLSDLNFDILIRLHHSMKNNLGEEPRFELPEKTTAFRPQLSNSNGSSIKEKSQAMSKM